MTDTPDSSVQAPARPATPPPVPAAALLALVLSALALAAAGWSWFDSRDRLREQKTELARRLAEIGKEASETRLLARNADDRMRQIAERLASVSALAAVTATMPPARQRARSGAASAAGRTRR